MNPILNLMVECCVRSSLIALGVAALLFLLRVRNARARHAVWASVAVWMLALPVWSLWGPRTAVRLTTAAARQTYSGPPATQVVSARAPAEPLPVKWTWQNTLAAIYLAGLCLLLARLAIGASRVRLLIRRAVLREGRLTSDSCAVPITAGWLHPVVLLPAVWHTWPAAQLDAVLTHEGEHARRRDPLAQWLAQANRAVFWFHPLAWWLERRLSALAEEACDAAVLVRGHDPFEYAEYLMAMARAMQQAGSRLNFAGMTMPGASLPGRIRRILQAPPAPRMSRTRTACVAVACAAVSTLFTAGAVDSSNVQRDVQVLMKPVAATLPAALADAPPATAAASSRPRPVAPRAIEKSPHARRKILVAQAQTTAAAPAAQDAGSLSGTVEDATGARVPNCTVTLRDQTGASVATAPADAAGIYRFASIPAGDYSVDYSARGFAIRTIHVRIAPGKSSRIDAALDVGQIMETVEVTVIARAPRPPAGRAPSTAAPAPKPGPITVGGRVQAARLLRNPQPVYPPELQQQGVEGTVRLRARISRDGVPVNLHVLNEDEVDPRMAQAAVEAVRQWRYEPSRLDGEPVEVTTNIAVEFHLGN